MRNVLIFLLSFSIAIAVFVWTENEIAPSFQTCIAQNYSDQSSNASGFTVSQFLKSQAICSLRLIDRHNGFFAALSALIVAIFTFTLWRSTDSLWKAGERQLIHLKASSEQQLRAYIGIEYCQVITRDGGYTFTVEVCIKNTGATPARDVHHHIVADIFTPFGERIDFTPPGRNLGIVPLAPGMSHLLETPIAIGGPTGVPNIEASRQAIFTWGRINYWDVFGREQHVMFRFRSGDPIRKQTGTTTHIQTVGWRMNPEDQGNSAT